MKQPCCCWAAISWPRISMRSTVQQPNHPAVRSKVSCPRNCVTRCTIFRAVFVSSHATRQKILLKLRCSSNCAGRLLKEPPYASTIIRAIQMTENLHSRPARPILMAWSILMETGTWLPIATCGRTYEIFGSTAWITWSYLQRYSTVPPTSACNNGLSNPVPSSYVLYSTRTQHAG
jgi:hypothetical protein